MKRLLSLALLFVASIASAQQINLFQRVRAPGAAGDVYCTTNTAGTISAIIKGTTGQAFVQGTTCGAWGTLGVIGGGTGRTSYTAGSVIYADGTVLQQDNVHFFWDATNKRLGVGPSMASDPSAPLNVRFSGSGFTPGPAGLFENLVGDAELWVKGPSTQNVQVTLSSGRDWALLNMRSGIAPANGFTICDGTAEPTCETTGLRFAIDSSGNIFHQLGATVFGAPPGTSLRANSRLWVSGGAVAIGGTAGANVLASLEIDQVYGGNGRITQLRPEGASLDGLNILASTDSGSAAQWWSWGPTAGNVWRLQPNATSFSGNTGLNIDVNGKTSVNAAVNSSYDFYSPTQATKAFTLLGATSGSVGFKVASTGGDGTVYQWPAAAPGSSQCVAFGAPSSGVSSGSFVSCSGGGGTLEIKENDGTPDVSGVVTVHVTNGKLTDNGSGDISLDLTGTTYVPCVSAGGSHASGLVPDPGATLHSPPWIMGEDCAFHNPATAGGGSTTSFGVGASRPSPSQSGNAYYPTDGYGVDIDTGTAFRTWGPLYPFTFPPTLVSTKTTTLSANINNAVTSLTFTVGTGWPALPFLMQIGTEVFTVTALNTGTGVATVTRGYNGTSAASHTAGDTMTQLNWIWVNQGATATATQHNQGFTINGGTSSSSQNPRALMRLIGSNTSFTIAFVPTLNTSSGNCTVGLMFRESSTGKIARYKLGYTSGNILSGTVGNDSSLTVFGTNTTSSIYSTNPAFVKGALVSTNMVYSYSSDLQNWVDHTTIAKTSQFTTAPDQWGVYDDPQVTTANKCFINVLSVVEAP